MVTQYTTILDVLQLWGLFPVIVVLVLAAIEGGYRLGSYRHRRSDREKDAPVGAMVGATLGLLAFMLAFRFGMAASRFDTRKQLVLDEANAIGTTYLRTAMLPEQRDDIRALLRSYVDARLDAVRSGRVAEAPSSSRRSVAPKRAANSRLKSDRQALEQVAQRRPRRVQLRTYRGNGENARRTSERARWLAACRHPRV
jgi:hypothetical protein